MRMKHEHTSGLSGHSHPMSELFFAYAQLKNLYRQGWLKRGVSEVHCETVAEHSFGVALLGYIIAEEYRSDLDPTKVMMLGLFHEIGEIHVGDITPDDDVSRDEKTRDERRGVTSVFSHLADPQKYITIWEEYELQKSPEARFVKQIDSLEMALQARLYETLGYTGLDDFFTYVLERITDPDLTNILKDILNAR